MNNAEFEKVAKQLAVSAVTRDTKELGHIKQAAGFDFNSVGQYLNTPGGRYALGGLGGAGLGALVGAMQPKRKGRNALYYGALGGLGGLGLAHLYNSAGAGRGEDKPGQKPATPAAGAPTAAAPAKPAEPDWRPVGGRRPPGQAIKDPSPPQAEPGQPLPESPDNVQTPADAAAAPAYFDQDMFDTLPPALRDKAQKQLFEADTPSGKAMRTRYFFPSNSPEHVASQILAQPVMDANGNRTGYKPLSLEDVLPSYAGRFSPGRVQSMIPYMDGTGAAYPTANDAYLQTGHMDGIRGALNFSDTQRHELHKRILDAVNAAAADPERKDLPNFGFSLSAQRSPLASSGSGGGDSPLYRSLRQSGVLPQAAGEHFVHSGFNINDPGTFDMINKLRSMLYKDPTTGQTMTAYDAAVRQGITTPAQLNEFMRNTIDEGKATVDAWTGGGGGSSASDGIFGGF